MKTYLAVLLLCSSCLADTCLIVARASAGEQTSRALFTFKGWHQPWNYVAGDFPQGMKFHNALTDNDLRKIKERGVKVTTLPAGYTAQELEQAKGECEKGSK